MTDRIVTLAEIREILNAERMTAGLPPLTLAQLRYAIATAQVVPDQRAGVVKLWRASRMPEIRAAIAATTSRTDRRACTTQP